MRESLIKLDITKKVRVIIDTDAACEIDDQYAIAHALMSDKIDIVGIIAEHFGKISERNTMLKSKKEIEKILTLMSIDHIPVFKGNIKALTSSDCINYPEILDNYENIYSEGALFIIKECLRKDERPLFIIAQGALSTIASAILINPNIGNQAVCISIGGCHYPEGGFEFNYHNDPVAANIVMNSIMPVWQVPEETYSQMQTSIYELNQKVRPYGQLGQYLFNHLLEIQSQMIQSVPLSRDLTVHEQQLSFPNGESWSFGDSCGLGIILCANVGEYQVVPAPQIRDNCTYDIKKITEKNENHKLIRIYTSINSRMILEDFFAKLAYYFG